MTVEFKDVFADFPDWKDGNQPVEIRMANGELLTGDLRIDDSSFDGEDEYPIFNVHCADGRIISFVDAESWRRIGVVGEKMGEEP